MSENTTDTPITDAFYDGPCKNAITRRQRDFARDLERQLAEARDQRDRLAEALRPFANLNPQSVRVRALWGRYVQEANSALATLNPKK